MLNEREGKARRNRERGGGPLDREGVRLAQFGWDREYGGQARQMGMMWGMAGGQGCQGCPGTGGPGEQAPPGQGDKADH